MIELIAVTGNYRIYSDFGTSVAEGTSSSSSRGPGVGLNFFVEQINPILTSAFWTIAPITGSYDDFWNSDSGIGGGSPATRFDLSMFLSFGESGTETASTYFFGPQIVINADNLNEGNRSYYFQVHTDAVSAARGVAPDAQVQFTIIDDDGLFDPTGEVVITGATMAGSTLRADTSRIEDGDGLGAFEFQWFGNGSPISGATSGEYLLQTLDAGTEISVQVSYVDGAGEREEMLSMATRPVSLGAVVQTSSTLSLRDYNQTSVSLILTGTADIDGTGNGLDNIIRGNAGNNALSGLWGNDSLFGGLGDDTLLGGGGNDTVFGGEGRDLVYLNEGDDVFHDNAQGGEQGQDTVFAGLGNDTILGGDGNDVFDGQNGNDLIYGNLGSDLIFGGGQFDTIHGGEGNDTVFGGDGRDLIFLNQGDDLFHDNAQGGAFGQDTVYAGFGNDTIQGGNGNDQFFGQDGDDLIFARLGDDIVGGGNGNDTLDGGGGNDTLTGGFGSDVFVFNIRDVGIDLVTDFLLGTDQVQLSGTTTATVNYNAESNEVTVLAAGDAIATLRSGGDLSGFGLDDIAFV